MLLDECGTGYGSLMCCCEHGNEHTGSIIHAEFDFCYMEMYYTGCPRRNVKYFGRVFLMLNYTDITQNTYFQS